MSGRRNAPHQLANSVTKSRPTWRDVTEIRTLAIGIEVHKRAMPAAKIKHGLFHSM